ncbi:hypothetical protein [Streptomyces laculatispora]|uniref:hypothetical protein n=1 Tax=Streptomyces laculatispora TaxID=887464 RepID=UPI001A949FE8|nr:hypothetical protein [Streptomyces laculatispora]MBO0916301.1 hypothetical protein [Streptomyces laculatispora]
MEIWRSPKERPVFPRSMMGFPTSCMPSLAASVSPWNCCSYGLIMSSLAVLTRM